MYIYVSIHIYIMCGVYVYIYITLAYEIDICLVNVVFYVFSGFICLIYKKTQKTYCKFLQV